MSKGDSTISGKKLGALAVFSMFLALVISGIGLNPLPAGPLAGTEWRLVSVNGKPTEQRATLRFAPVMLFVNDGCNHGSDAYWLAGSELISLGGFATLNGCIPTAENGGLWHDSDKDAGRDDLFTTDDVYRGNALTIDGDELTLTSPSKTETLRFVRVRSLWGLWQAAAERHPQK